MFANIRHIPDSELKFGKGCYFIVLQLTAHFIFFDGTFLGYHQNKYKKLDD